LGAFLKPDDFYSASHDKSRIPIYSSVEELIHIMIFMFFQALFTKHDIALFFIRTGITNPGSIGFSKEKVIV
jgi:hypothetical protein